MKEQVRKYIDNMIHVFLVKYDIGGLAARMLISAYGFNQLCEQCNYVALHDDPEVLVDEIYEWAKENGYAI